MRRLAAEAADPKAVEKFWVERAEAGTPLVEEVNGRPDQRLVTFVWRADPDEVAGVRLIGSPRWRSPMGYEFEPDTFVRHGSGEPELTNLAGTDVWYDTSQVRSDLRMAYTVLERPREGEPADGVPDRLNPRPFPDALSDTSIRPPSEWGGWDGYRTSVAELPDARPGDDLVRRDGVAGGTVTQHEVTSAVMGDTRRVWVYRPAGAESPLPVAVLHDGFSWAALTPIAPVLDNLIAAGAIPPLLVVMHESPDREELACRPRFVDFLTDELLPWTRERHETVDDPARTIVAGQSYGGLNAAFSAASRPDVFGNVISQSGSFWYRARTEFDSGAGELIRRYACEPRHPIRFYLDVGLLEADMVSTNRHFRDVLVAKGYDVRYQEFHGDHSWLGWRDTIGDAFRAITGPWLAAR